MVKALNDINELSNVTIGVRNFVDISRSHNRPKCCRGRFILIAGTTASPQRSTREKGKRVPFSIIMGYHNGEGGNVGAV